ncbi:hypothetical protein [Streptomyces sp. PT19]
MNAAMLADLLNCTNHDRPRCAPGGRPPISGTSGSDCRIVFELPRER